MNLGGGLVVVSGGTGTFTVTTAGITGNFVGAATFGITGVGLTVNQLQVELDTAAAVRYIRVAGTGVGLQIAGQTLTGDFVFEESADSAGGRIVKVAADNVGLKFGSGSTHYVNIAGARGQLLVTPAGVAGSLTVSGNVFNIPGLTVALQTGGSLRIDVNTIRSAVTETFRIAGKDTALDLPAGPFTRVTVVKGQVTIASVATLTGNFFFDQSTRTSELGQPITVTRIGASNVQVGVTVGSESANLTDGQGGFVILDGRVAGLLSGQANVALGPVAAGGNLLVRINNTPGAVDETIELGGQAIAIRFAASESVDFFDVAISNLSLHIGNFVTLEGSVTTTTRDVTRRTMPDGPPTTVSANVFAGEGLDIFLGRGPARLESGDLNPLASGVLLSEASVGFIRFGSGATATYALVAEGTVRVLGIHGVTLAGTAVVRVNTTGSILDETLTIPGSSNPGVSVTFDDASEVKRFEALDAELSVLGQSLTGDFSFDLAGAPGPDGALGTPDDVKTLRIAATGVDLTLGEGATGVTVRNASGAFIVANGGIAGQIAGTIGIQVPDVSFAGDFTVAINTTLGLVSETFAVGSTTLAVELPAGRFLRVQGVGVELTVAGQTLSGDFAIERVTSDDGVTPLTTVGVRNVTFGLQAGSTPIVSLTDGRGAMVLQSTGLAGEIRGLVALSLPAGIECRGDFHLAINNTRVHVIEQFSLAGQPIILDLAAGPYVQVTGTGVRLEVLGQTLSGDFAFEQSTSYGADRRPGGAGLNADQSVVQIAARNVNLSLGGGIIIVSHGVGALFITPG